MRRRPVTPAGQEALAEALAATDLVLDARAQVHRYADVRRRAVLKANRNGASYGTIAAHLGISVPGAQQLVNAAKKAEEAAP